MTTFLGSLVSGIQINENSLTLISGGNDAIKLLSANQQIDFCGYSLSNLGAFSEALDMNSHRILNVSDPLSNQDAATKAYVDTSISNLINGSQSTLDTLNEIANALGNDENFSVTITNLIGTKLSTADFNSTFDTRLGLSNINQLASQTGNYSTNNYKIVDLADPTQDQDAATKYYVDSSIAAINTAVITSESGDNKVQVTDTQNRTIFTNSNNQVMVLDSDSLRPSVPIDMNNAQKIVGVMDATDSKDAMNLGQDMRNYWLQVSLSANITSGFTSTYTVPFDEILAPDVLTTAVTRGITNSSGVVSLAVGKYMVSLYVAASYDNATSVPVTCQLIGSVQGVSPYFNVTTNRAPAFGVQAFTCLSGIVDVATPENFRMRLTNTSYLNGLDRNTKMVFQRIQ